MKGREKRRKRGVLRKWEKGETEIDEHEGGKEWKEELDGTLAASACSQEDYSSTTYTADCQQGHREASWMEIHNHTDANTHRNTQTYYSRCLPCCILMSVSPVSCSPSFTKFYSSFLFSLSFIPHRLAYSPPTFFSFSLHLHHSLTLSVASPSSREKERLGLATTRQVTYAASSGCLNSSFCFAVKNRGGHILSPSILITHSIFWPFISFLSTERVPYFTMCPPCLCLPCSNMSSSIKS